jgi:hypothetical protein
MYRSNQTQILQNYFDSKLVRTRENPYSIDAQFLNVAACSLDDASLRFKREIKALQLPVCPTGIDNNGIYYKVNLDNNYSLSADTTSLNSVIGTKNGVSSTLNVYDDLLPIPAGYKLDPNRSTLLYSNPVLITFEGQLGTEDFQYKILTEKINISLPIINKLSFWIDNTNQPNIFIDIAISGVKYPQSSWDINPESYTETLQINEEGYYETINSWISIESITVRNLPTGGKIVCQMINFNSPASIDIQRSAVLPGFRDQVFDKYWQVIDNNSLQESYYLDNLSGLTYYQSYNLSLPISCVTVEPNTWGGLLGSGSILYYFDRREPMPNLSQTGLLVEPCYGLDVFYAAGSDLPSKSIVIRPIPYKNSNLVLQYRIIIELPDNTSIVLFPDGSIAPFGSQVGWQSSAPKTIIFALPNTGLYTIILECYDSTGAITSDKFPYDNFDVVDIVKGTYDLSDIVVNIESIAYDFLGNLWLYDGYWAIPIVPYYNSYILDAAGRAIYLTDNWDQISYE